MPQIDLYAEQYDELIRQKGMRVLWEEAMACYCLSEDTGQPDFNCRMCGGSGFIYSAPKETKVLTTGLTGRFNLETIGLIQKGTAYATALSSDLMGYHDRLTFPDFNGKYSQTVSFTDGRSSKLHRPAKKILRCMTAVAEFVPIRETNSETGLPAPDFKIAGDGFAIEWVNLETWPPDGTRAALLYVTSPSYIIDDITHELRATFVKYKQADNVFKELPKQYSLKREDFIYEYDNGRLS